MLNPSGLGLMLFALFETVSVDINISPTSYILVMYVTFSED